MAFFAMHVSNYGFYFFGVVEVVEDRHRMYREFSQLYDEGMLYATVIGADLKTANHVQC
jgi:hypothetical protein